MMKLPYNNYMEVFCFAMKLCFAISFLLDRNLVFISILHFISISPDFVMYIFFK